jgi:2,4-dienoyl-CoA reductase-like NADH-dependent reductase (Old Yellow Enzyme family)
METIPSMASNNEDALQPLLQPIRIGDCLIPNRLMTSAVTLQYGDNGFASDLHSAYYRERAEGGVGLILSEQLNATSLCVSPFGTALHADDAERAASLGRIVEALAHTPTRFFAQLFASGVCGAPTSLSQLEPLRGPSDIGFPGGQSPVPLTGEEIAQIVEDFARSAANVKAAGCHGIEIHGAHGWLIGEFFSPYYNRREDAYGGSVENRCRLALEIGAAVRAAVGRGYPLGLSLSYDEMIGDAGITPADTLAQLELLAQRGVYDFFDFSIGAVHNEHFTIPPMDIDEGCALDFAGRARAVLNRRAAVMVSGRVVDIDQAAGAVGSGQADMVAMSRAHIAEPHILKKALAGERHLIRRCIGDNACLQSALSGDRVKCLVNPRAGREHEIPEQVNIATKRKRVMVVGAGPAGLAYSQRAAMAGHDVTLYERQDQVGGHARIRAMLPYRQVWNRVTADLVAAYRHAKGKLVLGTEVTERDLRTVDVDLVVFATGYQWADFQLAHSGSSGGGEPQVVRFEDAVQGTESLGQHLLIIDETGSYEPLGLAEKALLAGSAVTLLTSRSSAADQTRATMEYPHAMPRLRSLGLKILCEADLASVNGPSVEANDIWGNGLTSINGVTSIVATTARIPSTSGQILDGTVANAKVIGDARVYRDTAATMHDAYFEAANL